MIPDLPKIVADLIKSQWSLEIGDEPSVAYKRESYMMNSRIGAIYVYMISGTQNISTIDYRTTQRVANLSIRLSNPDRDRHLRWMEEIERILMVNRRAGPRVLGGFEFLEITSVSPANDLSGYHTTTIDIRLTGFAFRIRSAGFGVDCMDKEIGLSLCDPTASHRPI